MILGIVINKQTGTFHPILFRPAPMPSGMDEDSGACRYRSAAHHTEGFATEAEADAWIDRNVTDHGHVRSDCKWEWDGTDKPVMTTWFPLASTSNPLTNES